jgi:phosphomannomutase
VEEATPDDGLQLALSDGFLMLRCSGTESVLRLYAEAPDAKRLERRFADGLALVSSRGRPPGSCRRVQGCLDGTPGRG